MSDEFKQYSSYYKECGDCIHKNKIKTGTRPYTPCDSCEQPAPTNFAEEPETTEVLMKKKD